MAFEVEVILIEGFFRVPFLRNVHLPGSRVPGVLVSGASLPSCEPLCLPLRYSPASTARRIWRRRVSENSLRGSEWLRGVDFVEAREILILSHS